MPSVTNSTVIKKEEAQIGQQAANEGAVAPSDGLGQIKQIVQNKLRNLEKRRARLETYKTLLDQGKTLTDEQQTAYAQLSSVDASIESQQEMLKSINTIQVECAKQQKLVRKREERDRQQGMIAKIREFLHYQDMLNILGQDNVRKDFLDGANGTTKCSSDDMVMIDDLYKRLCPSNEENPDWSKTLDESASFAYHLLHGTSKPVPGNDSTTFAQLKIRLDEIVNCPYLLLKPRADEKLADERSSQNVSESVEQQAVKLNEPVNSYKESSENISQPTMVASDQIPVAATVPLTNGAAITLETVSSVQFTQDQQPLPQRFLPSQDALAPGSVVQLPSTITFIQDDQTGVHNTFQARNVTEIPSNPLSTHQSSQPAVDKERDTYAMKNSQEFDQQHNTASHSDLPHNDGENFNGSRSHEYENGGEKRTRPFRRGAYRGGYNNGHYQQENGGRAREFSEDNYRRSYGGGTGDESNYRGGAGRGRGSYYRGGNANQGGMADNYERRGGFRGGRGGNDGGARGFSYRGGRGGPRGFAKRGAFGSGAPNGGSRGGAREAAAMQE